MQCRVQKRVKLLLLALGCLFACLLATYIYGALRLSQLARLELLVNSGRIQSIDIIRGNLRRFGFGTDHARRLGQDPFAVGYEYFFQPPGILGVDCTVYARQNAKQSITIWHTCVSRSF